MSGPILRTRNLTKRFGTFFAVREVDLDVAEGGIHSIIGPNGAGKTTLFRLLTGLHRPTEGEVTFRGTSIGGDRPHVVARKGLVQSFQLTSVFPRLTVLESVVAALLAPTRGPFDVFTRRHRRLEGEARELLERIGLGELADTTAKTLSHGDQRALDIALALATKPQLLLLDEPTAGMSPAETRKTTDLVAELNRATGVTILFSEHDMDVVWGISDRVTVIHQGRVLTEGTVDEVQQNPDVMTIYLGEGTSTQEAPL
jgi:branched-chain amino acid transport system ATP-binding protein